MRNIFEIIIGFLVLFIAIAFTYFAYQSGGEKLDKSQQYIIIANFDNAEGIKVGSYVKISGIVIGKVVDQELDYDTYSAVIKMALNKNVKLPEDSSAQINSSGLLGDKFILIVPGSEEKILQDGDSIEFTQSALNIEGMISKFLFGLKNNNNKNEEESFSKDDEKINRQNYIFNDSETENSIG